MRRVADQWPTFECHLPCGMRGCESHWSLKAHEWAEMRRGRDSEAGHVLLGKGQGLVLWRLPPGTLGSCTKLGDGSLLYLALRLVLGVRSPAACMALLSPAQRSWKTPRAGFCFVRVLQVMSQI